MKVIAYGAVKHHFEDRLARDGMSLDEASVGGRRPDVLARFETSEEPWGRGVAVEVQYRNESKDIDTVSFAYAHHGYSTVWLDPSDFDGKSVDFPDDPGDDRVRTPWPLGVPPRRNRPAGGQPHRRARVPARFLREWWGNLEGPLWIEKAMADVLGLKDTPGVLGVYRQRRRKATIYHEDLGAVHVQCRPESASTRIYVFSERSEPGPPYLSDTPLGRLLFNALPFNRSEVSVDPFLESLPVHGSRRKDPD